ncbi:211_t:CDS:2 [Entrophospora sp. SA101]|nr:211_t:CDS:2 [Entrophospora sp. SA101]
MIRVCNTTINNNDSNTSITKMPIHKPYASYIRSWKAKSPIIQLHLVLLEIDSFQETNKLDHVKKPYNNNKSVGLPKFRYKYLEHKLTLYLVHNGQIFIPIEALEGIEKISDRINYNWNSVTFASPSITVYIYENIKSTSIDNLFIKSYGELGQLEKAEKIFNSMGDFSKDPSTYGEMIKVYASNGKIEKAKEIANIIENKNYSEIIKSNINDLLSSSSLSSSPS